MNQVNLKNGFTLMELVVVMAILAMISGVGLSSFMTSQAKSRDAKRKTDLNNITKALEMYYNDRGRYPSTSSNRFIGCGDNCANSCLWGGTNGPFCRLVGSEKVIYLQKIPQDPKNSYSYYYTSDSAGSYYFLYANLENPNDSSIITDTSGANCGTLGVPKTCNFGVSSTNVVPGVAPQPTVPGPSSTPVPTPTSVVN